MIRKLFFNLIAIAFVTSPLTAAVRPNIQLQGSGYVPFLYKDQKTLVFTRKVFLYTDANGNMGQENGYTLLGYEFDQFGNMNTSLGKVSFSDKSSVYPTATTSVELSLNLDATAPQLAQAFDSQSFVLAGATSNFSVSLHIFDSLGQSRDLRLFFRNEGANHWSCHALILGSNLLNFGGHADETVVVFSGILEFSKDGTLSRMQYDTNTGISWNGGAQNLVSLNLDFGGFEDEARTTQYSDHSMLKTVSQNGNAFGNLQEIGWTDQGILQGRYSNGQKLNLYQVPLALFKGENFLYEFQPGVWVPTDLSGEAEFGLADQAGRALFRAAPYELP